MHQLTYVRACDALLEGDAPLEVDCAVLALLDLVGASLDTVCTIVQDHHLPPVKLRCRWIVNHNDVAPRSVSHSRKKVMMSKWSVYGALLYRCNSEIALKKIVGCK